MSEQADRSDDPGGAVEIPVVVARRVLRLLDCLGEAGVMGYRGDDLEIAGEPLPEAAELAWLLYEHMRPALAVGDHVADGSSTGKVVAMVLFPDGWEVYVDWEGRGVEITSLERLGRTDGRQ